MSHQFSAQPTRKDKTNPKINNTKSVKKNAYKQAYHISVGQTGTLVYRQKFVPKKSLHLESVSDFMVWITLPGIYVDKFCHIVADPLCAYHGPHFGKLWF